MAHQIMHIVQLPQKNMSTIELFNENVVFSKITSSNNLHSSNNTNISINFIKND